MLFDLTKTIISYCIPMATNLVCIYGHTLSGYSLCLIGYGLPTRLPSSFGGFVTYSPWRSLLPGWLALRRRSLHNAMSFLRFLAHSRWRETRQSRIS